MTVKFALIFGLALANMVCGGTLYAFSLYGPQFSTKLGYSQVQTNLIAIAGECGLYLTGPICGSIVDHYGPRVGCLSASFFLLVGYVGMAATYNEILPSKNFVVMSAFFTLCGFGSTCSYMSSISTLAKTFTTNRGAALGVPIAFYGLSAFIWTAMSRFFFVHNDELDIGGFLFFIGVTAGLVNFISAFGLGILTKVDVKGKGRAVDQGSRGMSGSMVPSDVTPLLSEEAEMIYDTVETRVRGPPVVIYDEVDITGWELFKDVEAWGFFLAFFCFTGTGLMYINSVGAIIGSLYSSSTTHDNDMSLVRLFTLAHYAGISRPPLATAQSLHVSIISITSCTGRVLAGVISDFHKRLLHMSRLWTFILFATVMAVGQGLGAFYVTRLERLMVVTILTGLAYGGVFSVSPTITAEFWGLRRFGTNWGFLSVAPAIGGLVSSIAFGAIYDEESRRQREQYPDANTCDGPNCFRAAFLFTLTACFVGLCFALLMSNRRHRRKMHFKRQKLVEYAEATGEGWE